MLTVGLGALVACAVWWIYFDVIALLGEHALRDATPGLPQNTMGRDAYSYLHFPMVAGIVLLALGMKKSVAHVDEPLALVPAACLFGGVALFILGITAFIRRTRGFLAKDNLAWAAGLGVCMWATREVDAWIAMAVLPAYLTAFIVHKVRWMGAWRIGVRSARLTGVAGASDDEA